MKRALSAGGLAERIFAAQTLVVLAGATGALAAAAVIGPQLFRAHLLEWGLTPDSEEMAQLEQSFVDAGLASVAWGTVVALASALVMTWVVTRRIRRPVAELTLAATRMGQGDYRARVATVGASPELDTLTTTFNALSERLESIEDTRRRLLSDVAHEMRTPLATINAHLEAVTDGVATWTEAKPVIEDQAVRLTRLVQDIEDVSRVEEGSLSLSLSQQDIGALLRDAAAQFAPRFMAKGITLTVAPVAAPVLVDAQRIGQLLANLLTNALRHTPSGGRVSVVAEVATGQVRVAVRDTGDGMSAEQLAHVFERFYRGDKARDRDNGGAGIGLTIARALAEAHGGTLTAASHGPLLGSVFVLTLPVSRRG